MNAPTIISLIAVSLLASTRAASQSADSAGSQPAGEVAVAEGLPSGWTARPDAGGTTDSIKFAVMEPGYHLTLGPATILYRKQDRVSAPFHAIAKFHQMKKLEHPEGYGLFFGGKGLDGSGQSYTYFLVRADGKFNVKRRNGEKLDQYTKGWVAHPAVKKADVKGNATNVIEIDAKKDPKTVSFKVNGTQVHSVPAQKMDLNGIVGIRANHYLDLHIEEFAIHQ
jgi:hypothetical protein